MAVQHVASPVGCDPSYRAGQRRAEAGAPAERDHFNAALSEMGGPLAFVIQTADGEIELRSKAFADLDDKMLGSTRRQTENHVQDPEVSSG
jgi:hypothetical protein